MRRPFETVQTKHDCVENVLVSLQKRTVFFSRLFTEFFFCCTAKVLFTFHIFLFARWACFYQKKSRITLRYHEIFFKLSPKDKRGPFPALCAHRKLAFKLFPNSPCFCGNFNSCSDRSLRNKKKEIVRKVFGNSAFVTFTA